MRLFNIIFTVIGIVGIVVLAILYLNFQSTPVDPLGDGQSGMGRALVGVWILLIAAALFLSLLVALIISKLNKKIKVRKAYLSLSLLSAGVVMGFLFALFHIII